jgi:hypothetical protein
MVVGVNEPTHTERKCITYPQATSSRFLYVVENGQRINSRQPNLSSSSSLEEDSQIMAEHLAGGSSFLTRKGVREGGKQVNMLNGKAYSAPPQYFQKLIPILFFSFRFSHTIR